MDCAGIVHECLFCPQTFASATAKDDHVLEHFAQETCTECNQKLIRIGSNLYTVHNTVTCAKIDLKVDNHNEKEYNTEENIEQNVLIKKGEQSQSSPNDFSCIKIEEIVHLKPSSNEFAADSHIISEHIKCDVDNYDDEEPVAEECLENEATRVDSNESTIQMNDFEPQIKNEPLIIDHSSNDAYLDEELKLTKEKKSQQSTCEFCGNNYQKASMRKHKIRIHNLCTVCASIFPTKDVLDKHKLGCFPPTTEPKLPPKTHCELCNLSLSNRWSYLRHCQSLHNPNAKKFKCERCGFEYKLKYSLETHACQPEKMLQRPIVDAGGRSECNLCGKFLSKSSLWRHKIVMHKVFGEILCNVCAKRFQTEDELDSHRQNCLLRVRNQNNKKPGRFECDICKSILTTKSGVRQHMRYSHFPNSKIRFKCKTCNLLFRTKRTLQNHYDRKHLNIRNFICSTCGKTYQTNAELVHHTYQHTGERPYKCSFENCQKRFRSKTNRDEHLRTHTGEKPFQCPVEGCNSRFSFRVDFRRHKFNVHRIYTKKFPCTVCGEILPENALLKKHMQKHNVQF